MKRLFVSLVFLALAASHASGASDYVIGDGDTLRISIWGEPKLSGEMVVRPDGKITLPAVGDVAASGYSAEELSDRLAEKLKEMVKNPVVTVTVTGVTNNKVYVFGGGVQSGVHVLPGRTTLLKFLCRLGDMKNADFERAYIMRDGEKLGVDFFGLFVKGDLSRDVMLEPGDIVYIHDNSLNKIYVMGAVQEPRQISYRKGISVIDALLEAGGFTKFAKENDVLVLRKDGEQVRVRANDLVKKGDISQNLALMPGDFVIVKEGMF